MRLLPEDGDAITTATAQLSVTVASADTLALSVSPAPVQGRMITIDATGINYDSGAVLALHQAAGPGGCGASPQIDPGTEVISDVPPGATGHYAADLSDTSIFSAFGRPTAFSISS